VITNAQDWAEQAAWRADYDRRLAARAELQRQLHEADPEHHSLMIPTDDPEFPSEAYTAGWQQEEDDEEFTDWDASEESDAAGWRADLEDEDTNDRMSRK